MNTTALGHAVVLVDGREYRKARLNLNDTTDDDTFDVPGSRIRVDRTWRVNVDMPARDAYHLPQRLLDIEIWEGPRRLTGRAYRTLDGYQAGGHTTRVRLEGNTHLIVHRNIHIAGLCWYPQPLTCGHNQHIEYAERIDYRAWYCYDCDTDWGTRTQ